MNQIGAIVANTPVWVWPLLAGLLLLGALQLADRTLSWRRLIGLPLGLGFLSLSTIFTIALPVEQGIGIWLAALLVGSGIGWLIAPRVGYDPNTKLLAVPGSVVPLLIIIAIFAGRYYFGYLFGRYPELRLDQATLMASVALGGFCAGLMAGRLAGMWFRAS